MSTTIAQDWASFDDAHRQQLLARMTPDQKSQLRQELEGPQATPPDAPPGPWSRFLSSAWDPIKGAVQGAYQAATAPPQGTAETVTNLLGPGALLLKRSVVDPAIDQGKQAVASTKEALAAQNPYSVASAASEAAGHALATVLPVVGPWAASFGQKIGDQIGSGDYAGAGGTVAGNAVLAAAPEGVKRVVPPLLRRGSEMISGTGPKAAAALAKEAGKANADIVTSNQAADAAHNADAQDAAHATRGNEIAHQGALAKEAQKIFNTDQSAAAQQIADHQQELQDVRQHNQRVQAKHTAVAQRIQEENAAQENTLNMRQQQQSALDAQTQQYYAQEDAAKARAKAEENAAWQPWRTTMKNVNVDGGEIASRLKSITQTSPEVTRVLRQLQPPAEDVPADSLYAQDRAAIMKSQGFSGSYFDYPSDIRSRIDQIAQSSGFEPDPIDFDPQAGHPIPVDMVHRAQSIIDNSIRSGRFEGPLLGEMRQVAKALRASVTKATADAGALSLLDTARETTRKYQDAFGKQRHLPTTQDEIREKQANPEAYKDREDEDRLSKAAAYDPSLVESYRNVKDARENLRKLPAEDQLRKAQKQVPPPPTVNDVREGYRLKPEPNPPQLRITSGSPDERAAEKVASPDRILPPDRPTPTPLRTISPEDVAQAKADALDTRAGHIAGRGSIVAAWPLYHAFSALARGAPMEVGTMAAESGATLMGTQAVAKLLQNPRAVDFLTKATPRDVAAIPPELRSGNWQPIIDAAKRKGLVVSPYVAALAATARPQHPTLSPASPVQ